MGSLTLQQALTIIDGTLQAGNKIHTEPLTVAQDADNRPAFISAVNVLAHGNMVPVPGGLLIRDKDKTVLGAIGVSGDISDIDESCAINGIGCAELFSDEMLQA
ncbi:heme-binding protein [Vibrio splendidus]